MNGAKGTYPAPKPRPRKRVAKEKTTETVKGALTQVTTHASEGFERTALIVEKDSGSIDLLDPEGGLLARINIFRDSDGGLMVDVIDVSNRFQDHRALGFKNHERSVLETGNLVAAHFHAKETARTP